MIHDLLNEKPPPHSRADICIVGAGAAGISLAVEFTKLGKSVFLLEGGGAQFELTAQEPYKSELSGLDHRGIHEGRFRVKGGTTTRWGGQILELGELDFQTRDWVPESGWPFPKAHLSSFYERALSFEGIQSSILQDTAVWNSLGDRAPSFSGLQTYLTRWCPEPDFARLHRRCLEGAGVDLWLHANAVELLMREEYVEGVRCLTQTGSQAIFKASEYVFCLGAIESSRFFLQPRNGVHCNGLPWNTSGLLGRFFQDHVDCDAALVRPHIRSDLHRAFDNIFMGGHKYHPKIRMSDTTQRELKTLNVAATMNFCSEVDTELATLKSTAKHLLRGRFGHLRTEHIWPIINHAPLLLRQTFRHAVQHRAFVPSSARVMLRVHCEQEPNSSNAISLTADRDSIGLFRARLQWGISGFELRSIRKFVELATTSLAGLAEIIPNSDLTKEHETFLSICRDSNHHMGGMRMHTSARKGVVNENLKLNGTRNCFICSAAVFPSSGFSNPTHTVLALAARLAQHLTRTLAPSISSFQPNMKSYQ